MTALLLAARAENAKKQEQRLTSQNSPPSDDIAAADLEPSVVELPPVSFVLVSVDTAFSERDTADWNAVVVLGVWHRRREVVARPAAWFSGRWGYATDPDAELERIRDEDEQPRVIVMEAWQTRARMNDDRLGRDGKPVGLVQRLIDTARRRKADRILI